MLVKSESHLAYGEYAIIQGFRGLYSKVNNAPFSQIIEFTTNKNTGMGWYSLNLIISVLVTYNQILLLQNQLMKISSCPCSAISKSVAFRQGWGLGRIIILDLNMNQH